MTKNNYLNIAVLFIIFLVGNILHIYFFSLNEILKIADSFAYLQMSWGFENFSLDGFGTGWFGFFYSFFIAIINFFVKNDMLSSFILNTILFNSTAYLCYNLGKNILEKKYNYLFLIFLFFSPILLHYNIHILSENIYIPLFLVLFSIILKLEEGFNFKNIFFISILLALLYFTRGEAFIYLGSIFLVFLFLFLSKKVGFYDLFLKSSFLLVSFFIFIFPYLFYMHSFTGEWGLTNKGSANLRQAELRGISKMDDDGFEQAVGELRQDNHGFIAGFAGGLKYEKPQKGESFKKYLIDNPQKVLKRFFENQYKLYSNNLQKLIVGDARNLYDVNEGSFFYKNLFFLILVLLPIYLFFYGFYSFFKEKKYFFLITFMSLFFTAGVFFTLFFVLDRYFVVFVPIFILFFVKGIQEIKMIKNYENLKIIFLGGSIFLIYSLGIYSYYNTFKYEDDKYEVKKIAGERLFDNTKNKNLKILERFPVVTYYSKTNQRRLTPFTDKLENLVEYARFNKINYLVVDNIDFEKYRQGLNFLLKNPQKNYNGLKYIKEFNKNDKKVIIYEIK